MQVTENVSDGLKREFDVKVPAAALEARVVERLGELKDKVRINGFRPGKVPLAHLKKLYGRSVMVETIETVVRETNAKIVDERGLKLAMEPKVTMPQELVEVEKVLWRASPTSPIGSTSRCCRRSSSPISAASSSSGWWPR